MSDIDDELLALAGGSSDDEGSDRGRSVSPPSRKRDGKKSPVKPARRSSDDAQSEEDEGEVSDANSDGSAAMDESDSDDDAPPKGRDASAENGGNDEDKYPVEGLYTSEAEKYKIMNMREVDREQILAERVAEVDAIRRNRILRQMVATEERKQAKKKRSADTAELEEDSHRTSKSRTGKGESAMDTLRRQKAEKQRRREDNERRKAGGYSPRGRTPDEAESDDEYARDRSHTPEEEQYKEQPPADVRDYDRVRLGRNEFAQCCGTPGFETAITGCYIRVALGPHPDTGIEQYRMALIKGFTTGRPYAIQGPNGPFVTDQYIKAAHGIAVKEFPFIACSSGKFTESELNRYTVTCNNEGVKVPTKAALIKKVDDINNLLNHSWTQEEIKARIARRAELAKRFDPAERARVSRLLEEAREKGEDSRVEELTEELENLSTQRLAFKTSLGQSRNSNASRRDQSEQDRLAERNRINRQLNADAVRKAQLKEKAKIMGTGHHHDSKTPKKASDLNGASNGGTSTNGTPKDGASKPGLPIQLSKLREEKKGVPSISKPLMDDDVIGALDLDIDIDI